MVNVVGIISRVLLFSGLLVGNLGYLQASGISGGQSIGIGNDAKVTDCALTLSQDEKEDCRRNTARSLSLQGVKTIKITTSRYFDSQGSVCPKKQSAVLDRSKVIYFLNNSIPVSQMAVMNYYGQHGECVSDPVRITLLDNRVVNFSLSSEGKVAYLSPVVGGHETDVFFYYCDSCSK